MLSCINNNLSAYMATASEADKPKPWFVPQLDLATQLRQELDRRAAASLPRLQLSELADKLIQDWYTHSTLIDSLLRRVRCLEVELALSDSTVSSTEPKQHHYEWAKELLDKYKPAS